MTADPTLTLALLVLAHLVADFVIQTDGRVQPAQPRLPPDLAVPGVGFGRGGYVRLSLTVPMDTIERSLPGFERALRDAE